jgi:hypothetical protein
LWWISSDDTLYITYFEAGSTVSGGDSSISYIGIDLDISTGFSVLPIAYVGGVLFRGSMLPTSLGAFTAKEVEAALTVVRNWRGRSIRTTVGMFE